MELNRSFDLDKSFDIVSDVSEAALDADMNQHDEETLRIVN